MSFDVQYLSFDVQYLSFDVFDVSLPENPHQKYLKLQFDLPSVDPEQLESVSRRVVEFSLFFVDSIAQFCSNLPADVKAKSVKQRKAADELIEKKMLKRQQEVIIIAVRQIVPCYLNTNVGYQSRIFHIYSHFFLIF